MPEGFGMLANLKDLDMRYCEKLESLPESTSRLTSHFCVSNFGNLIPEGFGDLSNLETLNLNYCFKLELLPASKSRHSESFYFLIFVLRRLWTSGQPADAQHGVLQTDPESSRK